MITFPFTVSIMGTQYLVRTGDPETDDGLKNRSAYVFYTGREIVIRDFYKEWAKEPVEAIERQIKISLRHEVTHAFLRESGLDASAIQPEIAWPQNEEMIDWFALQSPKIFKTFIEHNLL